MGEGGSIWILNATTYDWKLNLKQSIQMKTWSFPDTIPAGASVGVHIEWDENGGKDSSEVQCSLVSTPHTFRIQAQGTPKYHLQAVLDNFGTDNHSPGSTIDLGWRHDGIVAWTLSGQDGSFSCTNPPSDWMQANLATLGNRTLRHLCLPGSHNSGTSVRTGGTSFGSRANILCQTHLIAHQLASGCRFFDFRPVITSGRFAAGHYTYVDQLKSWQGGNGEFLDDIVKGINNFTAVNREFIIFDISHCFNTDAGYRELNKEEWDRLLQELSRINFLLPDPSVQDLTTIPLKTFIENQAAVIIKVPAEVALGDHAGRGFYTDARLHYNSALDWSPDIETEDAAQMSKQSLAALAKKHGDPDQPPCGLGWCVTQGLMNSVKCAIEGLKLGKSILDLTLATRPVLHSDIWLACSFQTYPNIIHVDAFDSEVTDLVIAINKYWAKD